MSTQETYRHEKGTAKGSCQNENYSINNFYHRILINELRKDNQVPTGPLQRVSQQNDRWCAN